MAIQETKQVEVQVFFETYFKELGCEAQVSRLMAKRLTLGRSEKRKKELLQAAQKDIRDRLHGGSAIDADQAQRFKENLEAISALNKTINETYVKKGVGRSVIREFRQGGVLYREDCVKLAIHITGWKVEPTARLDPSILARIEELRKRNT